MYKDQDPQGTSKGTIREDGMERGSPITHSSRNPNTPSSSKLDHRRNVRKDPPVVPGKNNDGCFNCGIPGHLARDCRAPKTYNRTASICFNCGERGHLSRDCKAPRRGNYGPPNQGQQRQARVNAIIPEEAGFNVEEQQNLEGTLTLFHSRVKVLFDTGASNSFIAYRVVQDLGLVPQTLEVALNAASPLGVSVKLSKVCKDCPLTLEGRNLPADLIVLSMREFDAGLRSFMRSWTV